MLALDHITVSARSLAEGVAAVESALGVRAHPDVNARSLATIGSTSA